MAVGQSVPRVDAVAKLTGKARYTDDFTMPGMRVAKYLRSTMAHGKVIRIETEKAIALPGVDAVFTFQDVPQKPYTTAGHPFNYNPERQDVADQTMLTDHVRFMGDEIPIVVAVDDLTANKALSLIEVEYQPYPVVVKTQDAMASDAPQLHEGSPGNIVNEFPEEANGYQGDAQKDTDLMITGEFNTQITQHCHLENHSAYAYMDDSQQIVIVSSTQIPHIAQRLVAKALDIPISKIRVIKPYIGGGFGAKQDLILEPMVAFLTKKLNGIPIKIKLTREECMIATRTRHPFQVKSELGIRKDGTVTTINMDITANSGAYCSHGHAIAVCGAAKVHYLYPRTNFHAQMRTVYTNNPDAGAMRGYGVPQMIWTIECQMEDAARQLGIDSVEMRKINACQSGDMNLLAGAPFYVCGLDECLEKGKALIEWDKKRQRLKKDNDGPIRHGLGMACFSYAAGIYPWSVETGAARLMLNPDGSVQLQVGATEIGQGSDTAFAQMVAEVSGIPYDKVQVVSTQDTAVTPFDLGSFASRQIYVSGQAVIRAAELLKEKILTYAGVITDHTPDNLTIIDGRIVFAGQPQVTIIELADLALDAIYHPERGGQIVAENSHKTQTCARTHGCTFVDLEVDIAMCQVKINEIYNIHDAGKIINPSLARGQVQGGMFMSYGAALFEEMLIDEKSGKIYNNNLLDYKFPTIMDVPDLETSFVETYEPTHPMGCKSLGEPPTLSPAPAIRNAILDATGVAIDEMPMTPKALFVHFKKAKLI